MSVTLAVDAIHANVNAIPKGTLAAGYVTGSPDIQWTPNDWQNHPNAVRIDQTPASTSWDDTADVDDVENGAVRLDEIASRAKGRMTSYADAKRPGQRRPAVYMSASQVSPVVNALINGGVTKGVGLFVANWSLSQSQAIADVLHAAGPFPIIGIQFKSGAALDFDVFSSQWLNDVSVKPQPLPDWMSHSGWVAIPNLPTHKSLFFNHNEGTIGYEDGNGNWHRLHLP